MIRTNCVLYSNNYFNSLFSKLVELAEKEGEDIAKTRVLNSIDRTIIRAIKFLNN